MSGHRTVSYTVSGAFCLRLWYFITPNISRVFGYFYFAVPTFIVCEPECIQRITTSDYEHFIDHRLCLLDPVAEPLLGRSMFLLTGHRWRDMRTTFSQAFTGSKLRKMFALVQERCDEVMEVLHTEAMASSGPYVVEMKELAKRYMVDVIASTEFGYKVSACGVLEVL